MAGAYFSLIVWTHNPDMDHFKNMLESIDDQEYREFELYILDENGDSSIETLIKEFFPDIVDKAHYRVLKKKSGGAYAFNIGSHFAEGDHLVFIGQHDKLSTNTLTELAAKIEAMGEQDGIIYTDHDELVDLDRMNPHFKSDFNKELFLNSPYIGDFFCLSAESYKALGPFNEKAQYAFVYEYIMRASFKNVPIGHIPSLLYHKRQEKKPITKEERKLAEYIVKEHMAIAKSYLNQAGVKCEVRSAGNGKKWFIDYDESEFRRFGGDYMYLHDENVRLYTRNNVKKMYGYLRQPDVAVVGIRFLDHGLTLDNVGYIFDNEGIAYPAFYGQKIYQESYEDLATMPRDVAMVDAGCCLIDAKVYRMLHGFDTKLSGRDAMLDFCMRARERGYRTVVVPKCTGKYKKKNNESSEMSHAVFFGKHLTELEKGDPYYNKNLPMGLENYILPGTE